MIRAVLCSLAIAAPSTAQLLSPSLPAEPARAVALDEGPSALAAGNPAALAFLEGVELDLVHSGVYGADRPEGAGNTFALAGRLSALAAGGAVTWAHAGPASSFRRIDLGGALRLGALSLGYAWHGADSGGGRSDAGILYRPSDWLSLGAAVAGLEGVTTAPGGFAQVPRTWTAGLGLRPLRDRLELAADFTLAECTTGAPCGAAHATPAVTASLQLAPGVHALGQAQFRDAFSGPVAVVAALQLDLAQLGLRYGVVVPGEGQRAQDAWRLRLSSARWPSLRRPGEHAALVDLDRALARPGPSLGDLVFGGAADDPFLLTLQALDRLAADPSVPAVVLRTGGLPFGGGRTEELRAAVARLGAAGKKVLVWLESGGDLEYGLGVEADRVFAAPQALLTVNGFSATVLFAGAGLDKLGVKAEFFRVGAYKNAPDLFTRTGMSGEQREVENALLGDLYARHVRRIAERRHLDEAQVRRLLDRGILSPREALQAGLLDGLVYPDQLEEEVGRLLGRPVALEKVSIGAAPPSARRWRERRRIAVVRVEGDIVRGGGGADPLGVVELAGSDAIARRIRAAADDPGVAALVVRIDSPGGDGTASDLIWRELLRARKEKHKPVIASMGDVAASGGYYVAVAADEIWAEPSTITGSIGVFIGHFDAEGLYAKLGITAETVRRGRSADLFSTARALTDEERRTLQGWVDGFYGEFVDRVADGRHLTREQVDRIARGRVWTGAQAHEHGLVDRLGGFQDALRSAAGRAGGQIDDFALDDAVPAEFGLRQLARVSALEALPAPLPSAARAAARALEIAGEPGTLRAILPLELEVR